jgi:hypothetical protein
VTNRKLPNILVTGTPGTGKSTLCEVIEVSQLSFVAHVLPCSPIADISRMKRRSRLGLSISMSGNWCVLYFEAAFFEVFMQLMVAVYVDSFPVLSPQIRDGGHHSGKDSEFNAYVLDDSSEDAVSPIDGEGVRRGLRM